MNRKAMFTFFFSDKILCSNETAVEAQCVSEEVENCFSLNRKHMPLFGNTSIFSKILDGDKGADSHPVV